MFGSNELETEIIDTPGQSKCPVRGCEVLRPRQTQRYKFDKERFSCQTHRICISPSTFEYFDEADNMLWTGQNDLALWRSVKGVKRDKKRMARENSEDAVSWNVFRYLENVGLLPSLVECLTGQQCSGEPSLIYWSYDQKIGGRWQPLLDACHDFGERTSPPQYSEPDIIIVTKEDILFVEAKLNAPNRVPPDDPDNPKKYETGRSQWFHEVFQPEASFDQLANEEKFYELMRFWLVGSSIANPGGKRFWLVNLVRDVAEREIEQEFGKFLNATADRQFKRWTWEELFKAVIATDTSDASNMVENYLRTKTLGYAVKPLENGERRKLKMAFRL